jgi:hypothetical protein
MVTGDQGNCWSLALSGQTTLPRTRVIYEGRAVVNGSLGITS